MKFESKYNNFLSRMSSAKGQPFIFGRNVLSRLSIVAAISSPPPSPPQPSASDNACRPNPCLHGGMCVTGGNLDWFFCYCPPGTRGARCTGINFRVKLSFFKSWCRGNRKYINSFFDFISSLHAGMTLITENLSVYLNQSTPWLLMFPP